MTSGLSPLSHDREMIANERQDNEGFGGGFVRPDGERKQEKAERDQSRSP
jgi:hypothetical protein